MDLAFVIKLQQIIQDLNKSTNFFAKILTKILTEIPTKVLTKILTKFLSKILPKSLQDSLPKFAFMTTEIRSYDLGPNLLTDVTWAQICLSICSDNNHDWKFQSRSLRAARRFRIHIDHMVAVMFFKIIALKTWIWSPKIDFSKMMFGSPYNINHIKI